MPCSLCYDFGHNANSCWNKCLPLYYDNDYVLNHLKAKATLRDKMDGRRTAKRDEDIRIQWICEENLNDYTELGVVMKELYLIK